jgi:NADPH-dependent ferric siderophore reductase
VDSRKHRPGWLGQDVGRAKHPNGRAYLLGELQVVRNLRDGLEARGLERDRIFSKSYWRGPVAKYSAALTR